MVYPQSGSDDRSVAESRARSSTCLINYSHTTNDSPTASIPATPAGSSRPESSSTITNNETDSRQTKKRASFLSDLRDKKKAHIQSVSGSGVGKRGRSLIPKLEEIPVVSADDLRDKNWSQQLREADGVLSSNSLVAKSSASSDPSLPQSTSDKQPQKKHQINWLAQDMKQKEAALLEKSAVGKQKQRNTAIKYGW